MGCPVSDQISFDLLDDPVFYVGKAPPVSYRLHIVDGFLIEFTQKPPFIFHRWMMRLFFGWRFEIP